MERRSGIEDENPYKLLNLIPNEIDRHVNTGQIGRSSISNHGCSDDKKLELRLGLPGGDEDEQQICWSNHKEKIGLKMVSLGNYFPAPAPASWSCTTIVDLPQGTTTPPPPTTSEMENKAFSPPPANIAVPNSSQKRCGCLCGTEGQNMLIDRRL